MSSSHQAKGFTSLWVSVTVGTTHHVKCLLVSWREEARIKISEIKKGREKKRRKGKTYKFKCRIPKNSKER